METVKIFDFNDPVDFLNVSLKAIQRSNPQFSMRAWAKQLGLSHVAMLSMVLSKKRRLQPSLANKISQHFIKSGRFNETEARYFEMLVLFANAASFEEKAFYQKILSSLTPAKEFSTLQLDQLRTIADWYHIAILEMTFLKDFKPDSRWISLRLGNSVNQGQVREAIDRLLRLGLLEKSPDGNLKKTSARLATPSDIPNQCLRKHHREMIEKSIQALEEQPLEKRDITGHTLVISRDKIPEAKKMIRDFRMKLAEFLENPQGDSVYQINVQLFDLLEGKSI